MSSNNGSNGSGHSARVLDLQRQLRAARAAERRAINLQNTYMGEMANMNNRIIELLDQLEDCQQHRIQDDKKREELELKITRLQAAYDTKNSEFESVCRELSALRAVTPPGPNAPQVVRSTAPSSNPS